MKEKVRIIGAIGILAYIVLSFIDRAITKIPDVIYIPTALLIIAILLFTNNLKKYIRKK
jgi:prepilin signal peptidase PulO-like enzyme (type II secretory pathway)